MNNNDSNKTIEENELRVAIELLWEDIKASTDIIKNLKDENYSLSSNLNKFEELLKEKSSSENEILDELLKVENINKELTSKIENLESQLSLNEEITIEKSDLEAENLKQKEEIRKQNEKIRNLEEESLNYSYLQKEIARKNIDLNTKQDKIEDLNEEKANLQSKIYYYSDLEEKYKNTNNELIELRSENEKLLQNLSEITNNCVELEQTLKNKINEYQKELDLQNESLKNYSDRLYQNNREKTDLIKKIDQSKLNYENINTTLKKALEENERLESLLNEFDVYKKMLDVKEKELRTLKVELEKNDNAGATKESKISSLEYRINDMIEKEKELKLIIENKEKQVLEALELKNYNKQQLTKAEKILSELSTQVSLKSKQLNDLKDIETEKIKLEEEINEIKTKLKKLSSDHQMSENKIEELEKEKVSLTNQIFILENMESNENQRDKEIITQRLNMRDDSIKKLNNDKEELEKIIKTRYEQITILEKQLNERDEKFNIMKEKQMVLADKLSSVLGKIHLLKN